MFGLSGVITILKSLVSGQAQNELEFTEAPNMPFLYWLAVASAILKKKWTSEKQWPKLKVSLSTPTAITAKRLKTFKALAGWKETPEGQVPMLALMAESFRLVMGVLTLPAFPVSVLGTVVNKKARYSLLRPVKASEKFTYSCSLNPTVRETFSGHAEFDLLLEAVSEEKGDVVWQAMLTLVLMNPKKNKGAGRKEGEASAVPKAVPTGTAAAATGEGDLIDAWSLPENTGRAYAALDGDISPMHLYKATAMLMGFPSPVANVHLLAARAEASIATNKAGGELIAPYSLEIEFKKPTLLPNKLTMAAVPQNQDFKSASATQGYTFRVDDKKGKPLVLGCMTSKATLTRF